MPKEFNNYLTDQIGQPYFWAGSTVWRFESNYVRKIRAGEMTLEDVPVRWREKVREALEG